MVDIKGSAAKSSRHREKTGKDKDNEPSNEPYYPVVYSRDSFGVQVMHMIIGFVIGLDSCPFTLAERLERCLPTSLTEQGYTN